MSSAEIIFSRIDGEVAMDLRIDGTPILTSGSHETIVRELQMRGVRSLTIDDLFSTELPTSARTLQLAGELPFAEAMPALRLIAACAALGETASLPGSERRGKQRGVASAPPGGTERRRRQISEP